MAAATSSSARRALKGGRMLISPPAVPGLGLRGQEDLRPGQRFCKLRRAEAGAGHDVSVDDEHAHVSTLAETVGRPGIRPEAVPVTTYRGLFQHREFRALWTSSALTTAASTTSSLVLATVVHQRTGSALLSALALFGPSTVQVLGASSLMSAADGCRPRRTLTAVGFASTLVILLQAAISLDAATRLMLVLGAAYVASIGSGVRWGLLSEVIPIAQFALARSAMNVAGGGFQVVGFAGGGLLLTVLSVSQVFYLAALLSAAGVVVLRLGVTERPPRRARRAGLAETWRGNRLLLTQRGTRPLLIALCLPNGLVVGCEALFVPYAQESAGVLLAAGALGMMSGDLLVGRYLSAEGRRRAGTFLRLLLAAPLLVFMAEPSLPVAVVVVAAASIGYAGSLALQEWLVALTPAELRGQVLGVESSVRMTMQGVCAVLAGALADLLTPALAISLLAVASLCISLALTPAWRVQPPWPRPLRERRDSRAPSELGLTDDTRAAHRARPRRHSAARPLPRRTERSTARAVRASKRLR